MTNSMRNSAIATTAFGGSPQSLNSQDTGAFRVINRAVVIETLNDPSLRDEEDDKEIIEKLRNKSDYFIAPRNSIICRITTDQRGKVENSDYVCYPFFSSHLMMPVKPGEHVWILFEQPNAIMVRPFWLSRIPGPIYVEDANYTHLDRVFQENTPREKGSDSEDDGSGNFENPRKLKFQNGNPNVPELAPLAGGQETYEEIIKKSKEFKFLKFEPVPRVTKRPGDLVLQGSNNSSITLGSTMGWDLALRPDENTKKSLSFTQNSLDGSVDIVSGRGRIYQGLSSEKTKPKNKSSKNSTRPIVEENVFGYEVDKNVATQQDTTEFLKKGNLKTNPQEGDPDFLLDASRVHVTSNMKVDSVLGTGPSGVATNFDSPIQDKTGPAIVVKSDHIRIVARKNKIQKSEGKEPDDVSNQISNGTIRIVKEGNKKEDLASIVIESDGTIQISGKKIFLGRQSSDGGEGTGPGDSEAAGNSQPYVKYKELETLLEKTYDNLIKFVQDLQQNFLKNTTPGFGGPNPALLASAAKECTQFITAAKKRKSEIKKIRSKRIFGE